MKLKTKIFLVAAVLFISGVDFTFAADADCTNIRGNCSSTARECSAGGGSIRSSIQCTDTAYVCCMPQSNPSCGTGGTCKAACGANETIDIQSICRTGTGSCCVPSASQQQQESGAKTFPNPISANNANELLSNILASLRGVVAIISIIFIIIGGIMYMTAAGSEKMIDKAKAVITGAVVGLAIVMAAPAFLAQILDILGASDQSGQLGQALTIKQIAENVLKFLLSITGIIAIISLIIGGSFYLTAYGDEERIEKGKTIIKYSIIGIVVASAALVIVKQLAALIGISQ